jgi:hypothetical protein
MVRGQSCIRRRDKRRAAASFNAKLPRMRSHVEYIRTARRTLENTAAEAYARFVAKTRQSRRFKPSLAIELGVRRYEHPPDLAAVGASRCALLGRPFPANFSTLFANLAWTRHVGQKGLGSTDHLNSPSVSISTTQLRGGLHSCKINAQRVLDKDSQILGFRALYSCPLIAARPLGLNGYHFSAFDLTKDR